MKMSNTFTGLLRTLKSTSSAGDSLLLSSCESELTELMHQIDIMVETKRQEWEQQHKALQFQADRKEREIQKLRELVEHRNREAGQLQQKIEFNNDKHNKMISKYEEQLGKLKYEMEIVKKNYAKLQKNSSKQTGEADSFKEQLTLEKEKHNQVMQKQTIFIEELEVKVRDLETTNAVLEAKLNGMEEGRKALLEKSEIMQSQLLSYQGQLTRKKQLLDNLEQKHVTRIAELENEILRCKDELEVQSETIKSLQISLEEKRVSEEKYWKNQVDSRNEIAHLKRNLQEKDRSIATLEKESRALEKKSKSHERSLSLNESSLLRKSKEQDQILVEYKKECNRLKAELQNQSLRDAANESSSSLSKDIINLQNQLDQRKTEHAAEVEEMRKQMSALIEELHRRDATIANMSERAASMEDNSREISVKYDKKDAELQVANAQLEALRLENRHLRETTIEDHMSTTADLRMFEAHIADIESANARTIAQLEHENTLLRHRMQAIEEEREQLAQDNLSSGETGTQISIPSEDKFEEEANQKISSLQERLDETVKHYEIKLKELSAQNQNRSRNETEGVEREISGSQLSSQEPTGSAPVNLTTLKDFEVEDRDFTHFFDVLRDDSIGSSNDSRRQSVTKDFMKEEGEREKELQSLLEARIMNLEQKTNAAIQKYAL